LKQLLLIFFPEGGERNFAQENNLPSNLTTLGLTLFGLDPNATFFENVRFSNSLTEKSGQSSVNPD
jgi:hypothetical protein